MVELALEDPELSSLELAHKVTDEKGVFISESSVYRILKKRRQITAPSHILNSASNEFKDKTTRCGRRTTSRSWAGAGTLPDFF